MIILIFLNNVQACVHVRALYLSRAHTHAHARTHTHTHTHARVFLQYVFIKV